MRGLAGARFCWRGQLNAAFSFGEIKKQPLIPIWDKSCTPAIPPKLTFWKRPLASRAITRARWITGGSPSASTWMTPFKPPSKVHSPGRTPLRSHHPELSEKVFSAGYYSFSQVYLLFHCRGYYSGFSSGCQPLNFNSLKKILGHTEVCPIYAFAVTVRNIQICPPPRPAPACPGTWGTPPGHSWRSRAGRWCRTGR